ncbi:MAG: hypothetical protein EXX96DRAFT_538104 [Benjaminiella poitrasii]|nr:MAG: hypothetical protein EXX96DRAFT_538104 [Benjaminiella poitrasii]
MTKNNKSNSSSTWLVNWFSQLTKSASNSNHEDKDKEEGTKTSSSSSSVILPWKKDMNNIKSPSSSVLITKPTIVNTSSSSSSDSNRKARLLQQHKHRPSITISLSPSMASSERRNSQQTSISNNSTSSVVSTSDDQYSTAAASYYQRRDSSERSVLSELWSKAKRRHPNYPRFHWPHRRHHSPPPPPPPPSSTLFMPTQQQQIMARMVPDLMTAMAADTTATTTNSCPSSYRQQHHYFPRHLKRHSVSSLVNNNNNNQLYSSADNTPSSASRPSSVVIYSRPDSPNNKKQCDDLLDDIDHHSLLFSLNNNNITEGSFCCSCCYCCSCTNHLRNEHWVVKHELTKLAVDGLFSIPEMVTLPSSVERHVLQIGCGDAAWGIDVASQHSKWIVIGLDYSNENSHNVRSNGNHDILKNNSDDLISPYKRTTANTHSNNINIPKNFKLVRRQSLLQGLKNIPDTTFDFIASRFLVLTYSFEQYQALMTECLRICKPGGYIELMEMDMRIYHQRLLSASITQQLNNEVVSAIESKSLDPRLARRLPDLFVNVSSLSTEAKYISLPLGVWGGRLGVMFRDDIHALIESYQTEIASLKQTSCRTEEQLECKLEIMDHELESNRAFMNLHLMMVQK